MYLSVKVRLIQFFFKTCMKLNNPIFHFKEAKMLVTFLRVDAKNPVYVTTIEDFTVMTAVIVKLSWSNVNHGINSIPGVFKTA